MACLIRKCGHCLIQKVTSVEDLIAVQWSLLKQFEFSKVQRRNFKHRTILTKWILLEKTGFAMIVHCKFTARNSYQSREPCQKNSWATQNA